MSHKRWIINEWVSVIITVYLACVIQCFHQAINRHHHHQSINHHYQQQHLQHNSLITPMLSLLASKLLVPATIMMLIEFLESESDTFFSWKQNRYSRAYSTKRVATVNRVLSTTLRNNCCECSVTYSVSYLSFCSVDILHNESIR